MPIDASIPLQQIQQPNLLQTLGQVYQLKNAQQEGKLRELGIQQTQMNLDDQKALGQAYRSSMQNGQFDEQGFQNQVLQNAPRLYPQVVQTQLAMQKSRAELQKTQLENAKQHVDLAGQLASSITDQSSYDAAVKRGIQEGILHPGEAPAVYDPQVVAGWQNSAMTAQQHLAAQQKALEMQETGRHNQATEQQAQNTLQQTAARDKEMAGYHRGELRVRGAELGIQGQRNAIEAQRLGLEYGMAGSGNATGDAYLQSLPQGMSQQVKAIANGDMKMPNSRSGPGMMLSRAVMQYDPTYTDARYTGKQDFKTGGDAQQIQQTATMMEHLDRSLQNSKAVGVAPLLGTPVQTKADAAYLKDVQLYTGEIGKLVTGGVLGQHEGEKLESGLTSFNPGVRESALKELVNLAGGRIKAGMQKYKTATGQEFPTGEFFDKETQGRLSKYGVLDNGASAASPTPNSHVFSLGAWQKANPKGDANAAKAAAQQAGYQVVQ